MSKRGQNTKTGILIDTDDRAFARPDREQEPDREFNRTSERVPLDTQTLFAIEERPGFRRALVPDKPGEIQRYERAGWKVVTNASANISDDHGRSTNQIDSVVRINLNTRSDAPWNTAILMEQPLEYWQEDEDRRHAAVRQREEAINPQKYKQQGFSGGDSYGSLTRAKKFIR